MKKKIKQIFALLFLILLSFFTRFYRLDFPPNVVFDEAHFGLYATKYLSHQYYFDVHPPLGKLIFGLVAFFFRIEPGFDFPKSASYSDFNFLPLRATVALFGSLFVILIYFLVKELGFSEKTAFLASFLILFDNAFLVQSRLILMDIILLFFIFLSLYLYILLKKTPLFSKKWWLLISFLGIFLGFAISIKVIGFGILGLLWLWEIFEERFFSKSKKEIFSKIGFLFFLPIFLFLFFFAIHIALLWNPCFEKCGFVLEEEIMLSKKNPKEYAFFLKLNTPPSGNFFKKIFKVIVATMISNLRVGNWYFESYWYSFPLMVRPIPYFKGSVGEKNLYLAFSGNPIIWWGCSLGVFIYLYLIIRNLISKFKMDLPSTFYSPHLRLLLAGYLIFWTSFTIVPRFLLLYHYLTALVFAIIISVNLVCGLLEKMPKKSNILLFAILLSCFVSFLYFSPLTYGFPISNSHFLIKKWIPWLTLWQ